MRLFTDSRLCPGRTRKQLLPYQLHLIYSQKLLCLLQEASKFSRHSKRSFLTSQDINNALRFHNCEVWPFLSWQQKQQPTHIPFKPAVASQTFPTDICITRSCMQFEHLWEVWAPVSPATGAGLIQASSTSSLKVSDSNVQSASMGELRMRFT